MAQTKKDVDRQKPDRGTVLVVDDDQAIRETVSDLLQVAGYEVMPATNGALALSMLEGRLPDLILCDITMPEMDGHALYQAVRRNQAWTTIPFIFLTARSEPSDVRQGLGMGAEHYLTKPFEPEDLVNIVESSLARAHQIQEAVRVTFEQTNQRLLNLFSVELRVAFNAIYVYGHLLQDEGDMLGQDGIDEMLRRVKLGTLKMVRLAENLMLLASLESGALKVDIDRNRENSDLGMLINEVVSELSIEADRRHVKVQVQVPAGLVAECSPTHFQDAFRRLLLNSIQFSKEGGGLISITASQADQQIGIQIEDNGLGIDPYRLPKLFKPIEQIESDGMETGGYGIGLTIARSMMELQDGSLQVESQLGGGTTVTMSLPAN